jgi:hypothetical protein
MVKIDYYLSEIDYFPFSKEFIKKTWEDFYNKIIQLKRK